MGSKSLPIEWLDAYENLDIPIYIGHLDTFEVIYQNTASKALVGEVVGKKCYKSIRGFDSPCHDCIAPQKFQCNRSEIMRNRYIPAFDKYFNVIESLISWTDGSLVRLGILIDVTAENKLAIENKEKDYLLELQSAFVESSNLIMGAISLDEKLIFINQAAERALGIERENLEGKTMSDLYSPETVDFLHAAAMPSVLSGQAWKGEVALVMKDGTPRVTRQTISPIFNQEGELVACSAVIEDISEEKKKDMVMQWQSALIESSDNYISVADMDMKTIYNNPAAYKMLGYDSPDYTKELLIEDVRTEKECSFIKEVAIPTAIKEGIWKGRGDLIRIDGKIVPIEQDIFPVFDKNNEVFGVATIIRDIHKTIENETMLESQLRQQKFLSEFTLNFATSGDFNEIINESLMLLAKFLHLHEIRIYSNNANDMTIDCLFEYYTEPDYKNKNKTIDYSSAMDVFQKIDYAMYHENISMTKQLQILANGKKSLLVVPLKIKGSVMGFFNRWHL